MPKKRDATAFQRTRRYHAGLTAVNAALSADIEDVLIEHGKKLDLDMVAYYGLRDQGPVYTALVGQDFESRDEIATAFDAVLTVRVATEAAVDAVNAATKETMGDVLTENAVLLTLDLTDYELLTEEKQGTVHVAMVIGEEDTPYKDETEVKTAFDAAVLAAGS